MISTGTAGEGLKHGAKYIKLDTEDHNVERCFDHGVGLQAHERDWISMWIHH